MSISFQHADARRRAVGLVGHSVALALGAVASGTAALSFDIVDEPQGSDLFESGSDLSFQDLSELVFSHPGVHQLVATTTNGESVSLTIIVWPTEVLEVDELRYLDRPVRALAATPPGVKPPLTNTPRERQVNKRIDILRSIVQEASLEAATATLENSPAAPYYGCLPESLGAPGSLGLYGACYA